MSVDGSYSNNSTLANLVLHETARPISSHVFATPTAQNIIQSLRHDFSDRRCDEIMEVYKACKVAALVLAPALPLPYAPAGLFSRLLPSCALFFTFLLLLS